MNLSWATALFLIAGTASFIAPYVLYRRELKLRPQLAVLSAALSTIAGVCYVCRDGGGIRIGPAEGGGRWPIDFDALLERFAPDTRRKLILARTALVADGLGFRIQVASEARPPQILEFSGHRVTAARGDHHFDLVWVADVTNSHSMAESAARDAQAIARFRALFRRLPLPVWWRDDSGMVLDGNRPPSEIARYADPARDLAERVRAEGRAERSIKVIEGGRERQPVELIELPLDTGGSVGLALDRSALAAAQAELDRVAHGHRQVLEALNTAIAIFGPDSRLLFANTAFAQLWRLDPVWLGAEPSLSELLEKLRSDRALPEYADYRVYRDAQLALFQSLRDPLEEILYLPDDRTLKLRITRHPFGGLTFSYDDVTDRLALERSYNTLIDVQRETLDNLAEAIAVFGSDGRLLLWNPSFARLWQLDPVYLDGRPHIAALVDRTRPLYDAADDWEETKSALIDQVTSRIAHSGQVDRGDRSSFRINTVPLPDGNVVLAYLDISDTVQVQRALAERNDALEAAGRLKSEFVANVSYELRTPLNSIVGYAEVLTKGYLGALNERQTEYGRGILESSQHLLSLVNDILDLASIEAGQLALTRKPVDIHELLDGILGLTRDRAARLELELTLDCSPEIGAVMIDERRIRQALFNLVSNAIRFTPAGGTITLGARVEGEELALEVADTGIGIPPEHHTRVFGSFERGGGGARSGGAGLGLALVKSFVEMHGGRVELDSAAGQGTRVTCWLPRPVETIRPPRRARRAMSSIQSAAPDPDAPADEGHAPPARPRRIRKGSA
jgi:signal transduction histidine kinase